VYPVIMRQLAADHIAEIHAKAEDERLTRQARWTRLRAPSARPRPPASGTLSYDDPAWTRASGRPCTSSPAQSANVAAAYGAHARAGAQGAAPPARSCESFSVLLRLCGLPSAVALGADGAPQEESHAHDRTAFPSAAQASGRRDIPG
jgi:hypothetical protein